MSAALDVAAYLRKHGCIVWVTGSNKKARATKGVSDLFVLHENLPGITPFEAKKGSDHLRAAQVMRLDECARVGVRAWVGYLEEARAMLLMYGIITREAA